MKRLAALLLSGLASSALAAPTILVRTFDLPNRRARNAGDYAGAIPLPLPLVEGGPSGLVAAPETRVPTHRAADPRPADAQPPTVSRAQARALRRVLFDRRARQERPAGTASILPEDALGPRAYGTSGLDFTSSRLIPSSAATVFPYSAVGKIFFSDGTDTFTCSGAVIAKRLVLTAGHCLHDGPGGGFFQDFQFAPAYRDGVAPLGMWDAHAAFVTTVWADSGQVPNAEDWGILEMIDQNGARIEDVTGSLTYELEQLADNHLHLLGYPGNLDGGEEMHMVASGDYFEFDDGTVVYGSDMGGGSSGGPWVQNFDLPSKGRVKAKNREELAVVGVTSYGFTNQRILAQGASILTADFRTLRKAACANQRRNC